MRKRNVRADRLPLDAFIELEGTVFDRVPYNDYMQQVSITLDGTDIDIIVLLPNDYKVKEVIIND